MNPFEIRIGCSVVFCCETFGYSADGRWPDDLWVDMQHVLAEAGWERKGPDGYMCPYHLEKYQEQQRRREAKRTATWCEGCVEGER